MMRHLLPARRLLWMAANTGSVKTFKIHSMKKYLTIIIISSCTLLLSRCNNGKIQTATDQATKENFGGYKTQVKWGEHLVTVSACHDCHSPKDYSKPGSGLDSIHLLSGYIGSPVPDVNKKDAQTKGWAVTSDLTSWVGPWGVGYAAN